MPEDYDECGKGFDQMVLDGLKLNREATIKYIKGHLPTYPQFEKWVLDQKGGTLNKDEVAALNAAIRGYNHSDKTRQEILSAAGIPDGGSIKDAVNLNNLDDWTAFHESVTGA